MTDVSTLPSPTDAPAVTLAGAPVHTADTDPAWWRHAVIYQIYPRSFADGDGDGIGDLPGITARLRLPAPSSASTPSGSRPSTPRRRPTPATTSPTTATSTRSSARLADFDAMIAARARARPARSSSTWCPTTPPTSTPGSRPRSPPAPGSPERARYLFRDGKGENGELPPNNWDSVFGGPAWTRITDPDGTPGQWYLHLFDPTQPDFDWANPEVRAEFEDVLRFWLDRGVDGFRVDVAHGLVKEDGLPDWAESQALLGNADGSDGRGRQAGPDVGPGRRARDLPSSGARSSRRTTRSATGTTRRPTASCAPRRGCTPLERAGPLRPRRRDAPGVQLRLPAGAVARAAAARGRRVLAARPTTRSAPRPPGCCPTTTSCATPRASACRSAPAAPTASASATRSRTPSSGLRRARAATALMLALPGSAYLYQGEELGLPESTDLPDDAPPGPDLGALRAHRARPRRLPGADAVGRRRPVVRLRPLGPDLAAAAGELRGPGRGPAGRRRGLHAGALPRAAGHPACPRAGHRLADVGGGPARGGRRLRRHPGRGRPRAHARRDQPGRAPVALPEGAQVLLSSGPLADDAVPTDTTVWARW